MPLIADVVDGQTIQSAWGNQIRDRSCQRFSTLAELNSGWPAAENGAIAYTADGRQWLRHGGVWIEPGARGRIMAAGPPIGSADYTRTGTDQTVSSYITSVAFTLASKRALVVIGDGLIGNATPDTRVAWMVRLGTAAVTTSTPTVAYARAVIGHGSGTPGSVNIHAESDITLDPGTYYIGLWTSATTTYTVYSATEIPQLIVRDVGPG